MRYRLLPEWSPHRGSWITLPRRGGDWECCWEEVVESFKKLVEAIAQFEPVIAVVEPGERSFWETQLPRQNVELREALSNDTWCRDYGGIPVEKVSKGERTPQREQGEEKGKREREREKEEKEIKIEEEKKRREIETHSPNLNPNRGVLDFKFNGWGLKYPANWDNRLTRHLFGEEILESFNFVLEGGGVETNGKILLTTRSSTLEENRNYPHTQREVDNFFKTIFAVEEVIWITGTPLLGDDTDGHIDTLARFINPTTLLYASTTPENPNYPQLAQLEKELKTLLSPKGIRLVPIPLPEPIIWEGRYLPATYINFYLVNGGVILPIYNDPKDKEVIELFQKLMPTSKIVPVDASIFVRQNGSIHCLTRDIH
ncbi:MAG: hypothetical protein C6I01_04795 [Epsilonproteobacteria bacterium]|nr:hypothetical protein [Campylobacterota bacterium]NPA89405.1 agmatine deiminase family protein [Campylobacterota bacterium]